MKTTSVRYEPSFFRSEAALISAIERREAGALAVFFQLHAPELEVVAHRVLGLTSKSPELVRRACLNTVLCIRRGRAGTLPLRRLALQQMYAELLNELAGPTFFHRVWGRCLRLLGVRRSSPSFDVGDAWPVAYAQAPSVSKQHDMFYAILDQLAPRDRLVFCLIYVAGYLYSDVAAMAELPATRVETIAVRAARSVSPSLAIAPGVAEGYSPVPRSFPDASGQEQGA